MHVKDALQSEHMDSGGNTKARRSYNAGISQLDLRDMGEAWESALHTNP